MYEETTGRTLLQKILLILLLAMAILFTVLTAVFRSQPRVQWADGLLRPSREGETALYTGSVHGEDALVRVSPDGGDTVVEFLIGSRLRQIGRVTWPEGAIPREYGGSVPRIQVLLDDVPIFSGGYDAASGTLYREDGSWESGLSVSADTGYGSYWDSFALNVFDVLRFALGPDTVRRGSWGIYVCGLFLTGRSFISSTFYPSRTRSPRTSTSLCRR